MRQINKLMKALIAVLGVGMLSGVWAQGADLCNEELGCRRFTGVGLGVVRDDDTRPTSVKQVMAIRAAKLEAVRSLAEQINGINFASKSDMITSQLLNDRMSAESQAVLQGIRFVKVEPLGQGIYQAVVEIEYVANP